MASKQIQIPITRGSSTPQAEPAAEQEHVPALSTSPSEGVGSALPLSANSNQSISSGGSLRRATSVVKPSGAAHRALRPNRTSTSPSTSTAQSDLGVTFKAFTRSLRALGSPPSSSKSQRVQRANSESKPRSQPPPALNFGAPLRPHATHHSSLPTPRSAPPTSIRVTRPYGPSSTNLVVEETAAMDFNDFDTTATSVQGILPLPEGREEEELEFLAEIKVPALLQQGMMMKKISAKKGITTRTFRLDAEQGQVLWNSGKGGIINIENIKEMRIAADARNYREQFKISGEEESRWITIVYTCDGKFKTLHVVAPSIHIFRMWVSTLRTLYALRRELMSGLGNSERRELIWQRQYWKAADASGDSKLNFDEVQKMCHRLNIFPSKTDLKRQFDEADSDKDGLLNFADFQKFVKALKARPDIQRLFQQYAPSGAMEYIAFENFMRKTQMSDVSGEELEKIFKKYAGTPTSEQSTPPAPTTAPAPASGALDPKKEGLTISSPAAAVTSPPAEPMKPAVLSLAGFTSFLLSAANVPFTEKQGKIWQDMTRPICEYYISSSHNTYLVGNQLMGDSTAEGYIRALLQGCRSVELDIWDGDKEPCVYHGKTLTSKVSVREIAKAIAKYAFVASPYPLILSAEIHCKVEQQDMVAQIMREEFGDMLVTGPLPGREHEAEKGVVDLPSPEELKGRILLKAKKLFVADGVPMEAKPVTVDAESSTTETSTTSASENEGGREKPLTKARGFMSKVKNLSIRRKTRATSADPGKARISTHLAALLIYTVGVKCRGINKKETYDPVHLFSLSERTANKIMKLNMTDLIKHNRTHVVRIYPAGTRLKSSNYEPHRYWAAGAHLVAINWQTCDLGYMINYAMFQRNGGCGMILKPEPLRIKDKQSLGTRTKHFLDVTVVSAQQLPRPKDSGGREKMGRSILDPLVEVSVHIPDWTTEPFLPDNQGGAVSYSPATNASRVGGPSDVSSARAASQKTKVVMDNGFNPVWEQELSIPFDLVGGMKDLVFVRFEVRDKSEDSDNAIGVYVTSLASLQLGYRHLPLHDQQMSQYLFSTLFVKVAIRDA
ncbi:Phospholipase C [Tulasnella sp. 417]|nr:Phospholipase C [Tulasnella sp. 417]